MWGSHLSYKSSKTMSKSDRPPDKSIRTLNPTSAMPWSNVSVDDAILTLWPGTEVREQDLKRLHKFFKEMFDIEVTPVGCVKTLPDTDRYGMTIEGTGGRYDFFFFVKAGDVPKFAVKRFEFGMRWWSDVYFNHGQNIYPPDFLDAYPI